MLRRLTTLLFTFVLFLPARAQMQQEPVPPVLPAYIDEAPRIDGVLDDAVWQRVEPVRDFVQRAPQEGASPTERTEVRIAYDAENLFLGFTMFDSEPEKVRANIFDRGGRIDKDDRVIIGLDTYHDGRNAYIFEINPIGTQDDALLTDERSLNWDWNCVYFSEGQVTDFGWTLEVAIPFSQLRFSEGDVQRMGLAIMRTINRKNETVIWPFIGRDYRGILQVSQYATLGGMKGLRRGHNVQVKPYVLTGAQSVDIDGTPTSDVVRDVGVDVKYGISSNVTLDLTVNTDFAQVEADNVQLNLTRFNLFFPEKREFFLERAGLFSFGNPQEVETFFSRRIGISNDILGGARLTAQSGALSVGLLNLQTKQENGIAGSNFGVARVRSDVSPQATVGAIFTNLQRPDVYNRTFGADARVRFWGSSELKGWVSNVWATDPGEADAAGSIQLDLGNDLYSLELGYLNVGEHFDPGIGFVRRRDMIRYDGEVGYSPRPHGGTGFVRQLHFEAGGAYVEGQDHTVQSTSMEGTAMLYLRARDHGGVTVGRQFERLYDPFAIRPDVEIAAGDYAFSTATFFANSDPGRRLFGGASLSVGSFFGGTRTVVGSNAGLRVSKHLKLEGQVRQNLIALPVDNGTFRATALALSVEAATSRKLFAKALVQYDNFSKDLQANIRIDWIHTPGSDLFLVFNTSYAFADRVTFREDALNHRAGVAKLTYLLTL